MGQEVFELVCGMDMEEVETRLALQCAPLIAGIKISNLLIVPGNGEKALKMILESTDISYYLFLKQGEKSTYLLFRKNELINFLSQETVREILSEAGYQELELGAILRRFQKRYQFYMEKKGTFPHEMGLLLGYPVEDVKGFIVHDGKNFLYSGYWKVYTDVSEKMRLFRKFETARENLVQWVSDGFGIQEAIRRGSQVEFGARTA